MVKGAWIIGIVVLLASLFAGFPCGHTVSLSAGTPANHFLGTMYEDQQGELGEVAITARGTRFTGLTVVPSEWAMFNISGKIDKTGLLTGKGKAGNAKVVFTGQISGDSITGNWKSTWREGGQPVERTGFWVISKVAQPSQQGTATAEIDGSKTRCNLAILMRDNLTCTSYVRFKNTGSIAGTTLVGTWNTSASGPHLEFLDDPTYGVSGEGYFTGTGSKGDLKQGSIKVGTWSARNL